LKKAVFLRSLPVIQAQGGIVLPDIHFLSRELIMVRKKLQFVVSVWMVAGLLNIFMGTQAIAKTVEVFPNVFTIVHGEGSDSNSTFIITKDGVIVVDTRVSPREAKKVMAEIRKRTQLPILYTINTHYHGDHTFGNQVFSGSKTIIAHKNVRRALKGSAGKDHLERFKTFKIEGLDEVTVTPPNMVFEKRMEVYAGEYHLQLIHRRGHTNGDLFIHLAELKAVIAGDLIFNGQFPYMGDGYVSEWIEALHYMEDQDIEMVIPGHGDVGGKPIIIAMKHYLLNLKSLVQEQINNGASLKKAKEMLHPVLKEKYKSWDKAKRIDGNIERTYLELSLKEGS
jgi:cyclase